MPDGRIVFGNTILRYRIARAATRKTVSITVHPDASISVVAPKGTRASRIGELVRGKANWIVRKQWEVSRFRKRVPRRFVSGECYFYLGRQYQLKVLHVRRSGLEPSIAFRNGRFEATVPAAWTHERKRNAIQSLFAEWYREQAVRRIPPIVDRFARKAGLQPDRLIIKDMKQRWGSCGKDGAMRINWRIMMAGMSLVEYVVAHEVCHLAERNHSAEFWKCLEAIMPDYAIRKEQLAVQGPRFSL